VQEWIVAIGAKIAYIALGSPWENGFIEAFNAVTNCLMAKSSIRSKKPGSSSKVGAVIAIPCARTHHWATNHQGRKSSCPHSPRGRLRNPDQLCRPR